MAAESSSGYSGRWVCQADRVFDGECIHTGEALIVDGDTIAAIVPAHLVPPALPVLSAPGCTVLPGLMDLHVHFMRWQGPLFLAYGVTTIRDVGNQQDWILARRADCEKHLWPRIYAFGPVLDGPVPAHPSFSRACADLASARAAVVETAAAGTDGIKLYTGLHPEWLGAMVEAGHANGLHVSMHCGGEAGVLAAGAAGVDEFFHLDGLLADIWPDNPGGWLSTWGHPGLASTFDHQERIADRIRELGMIATPTLAFWDANRHPRSSGYPAPESINAGTRAGADTWRRALAAAQQFLGRLLDRGAPVLAGTDVPCALLKPGLSLWRELSLLVECGMSPIESLRAATSRAAACLGNERLGRIAPGCLADVVLVEGDPTRQIPDDPRIAAVVCAGRVLRAADLLLQARDELASNTPDPIEGEIARPLLAEMGL